MIPFFVCFMNAVFCNKYRHGLPRNQRNTAGTNGHQRGKKLIEINDLSLNRHVYTEDVGSSSLSSPTIFSNYLDRKYEVPLRFKEPWDCLDNPSLSPTSIQNGGHHERPKARGQVIMRTTLLSKPARSVQHVLKISARLRNSQYSGYGCKTTNGPIWASAEFPLQKLKLLRKLYCSTPLKMGGL